MKDKEDDNLFQRQSMINMIIGNLFTQIIEFSPYVCFLGNMRLSLIKPFVYTHHNSSRPNKCITDDPTSSR